MQNKPNNIKKIEKRKEDMEKNRKETMVNKKMNKNQDKIKIIDRQHHMHLTFQ